MNRVVILLIILTTISISSVSMSMMVYASNISPETIASGYRDSGDLDTFTLSSKEVTVTCPSGEDKTTLENKQKKLEISPIHYSWYNYGDPFQKVEYLGYQEASINGFFMYVIDGIVDRNANYLVAQVILEKARGNVCNSDTELAERFTAEIVAKCDGTLLNGISPNPLGVNFTSTNYEIACIP